MNKRILLLGNYPPPYGGVPVHIRYLAPYLVESGWEVYILSTGFPTGIHHIDGYTVYKPSKIDKFIKFIPPAISIDEVLKYREFALDFPKRFLGFLSFANFVKKIVKINKIKIISAYHLFSGFVGALISEQFSIPVITSVFGEIYSDFDFFNRRIKEVKEVCKISKKILSCSEHCAKSFKLLNLPFEAEVVYYGIDVHTFSPKNNPTIIRDRFGIGKDDKVVLFVGRMNKSMGLHILLKSIPKVLEKNKKIKFIIAGNRGIFLQDAIELMNKFKENVIVSPDVPFEDLPLYYAASTIVVAPSINNRACLGLAIAEAMATAKPVIGCTVGGTPEIIIDKETGILIPSENPSALTESILNLIDDGETIIEMGKKGRERAENLFDKDKTNKKMEQIFREVLGE